MRVLLFAQVAAVAFLLSGCPGGTESNPTGGGTCAPEKDCSSTGGSGGKGGSGGSGNGSVASSSVSGSGGANSGGSGGNGGTGGNGQGGSGGGEPLVCEMMLMDLTVAEQSAMQCSTESSQQCKQVIQGLCCPIAVTDLNSPEVLAYLEALKMYLEMGCMASCPPDPCPLTDKASCMLGMSGGICTP